jgi:predicted metalloendopeptidase
MRTLKKKTKIRSSYCEDVRVSRKKPAEAKVHAEQILALMMMSQPRFDRVERRDRRKSYNPMTVADLQKLTSING